MDETRNPFAPGAGNQPPELAGRDQIIHNANVALARVKAGTHDRGHLLLGLRGVGKTVLINRIEDVAQGHGYLTVKLEARANSRLADQLVPRLSSILMQLSRSERAKEYARKSLAALRAFASAFKVTVGDAEFGVEAATGVADSRDLELDLPDLMLTVGAAARADASGVALLIDEVQYLTKAELSALIVAMHHVSQKNLPLLLFGAGLPQLAGYAGNAKSYAERLFRYPGVGPLAPPAATDAIRKPIDDSGGSIADEALARIIERTEGYPFFLQMWGYHAWNIAPRFPITAADVAAAAPEALRNLDQDFFNVRFNRLTQREKDYLRAMAVLGPGPSRSGEVARALDVDVTTASSLRTGLIRKGMVYQSEYGWTAFTVPMFDAFMRRTMPDWAPPTGPVEVEEAEVGDDE